jgi:hypothetical protein
MQTLPLGWRRKSGAFAGLIAPSEMPSLVDSFTTPSDLKGMRSMNTSTATAKRQPASPAMAIAC